VVWYDLLSIPYAIRPSLDYEPSNLSLLDVGSGTEFGVADVWGTFKPALFGAALLMAVFVVVSSIACLVAEEKQSRNRLLLKTYNLRTAYRQDLDNEIVPEVHALNQSTFRCQRHGPWLLVVFVGRIVYMMLFTLSFFFLAFQALNAPWFDVLGRYEEFAANRNDELSAVSARIEAHYLNESERMAKEVEHRQTFCYSEYVNRTNAEWDDGALAQHNNHSAQMLLKSQRVDPGKLNRTDSIFVTGDTACDVTAANGAHILESDPMRKVHVFPNGTYKNTTFWRASDYHRSWDNFSEIEQLLTERCLSQKWCEGWTWIDGVGPTDDAHSNHSNRSRSTVLNDTNSSAAARYHLLSALSDPVNSEEDGVCSTVSRFDDKAFDLSSIDALQNRTDILREEYMADYQQQIETMSSALNGIWGAIQSLGDGLEGDAAEYTVIVDNDPAARGYSVDIQLNEMVLSTSSGGSTSWTSRWYVVVTCPGCPDGNFSSPHLQEVYDFVFGLNASNISDFVGNRTSGPLPVNLSSLVAINPALIEYPDLPTIDFPLKFDFPIDMAFVVGIAAVLDVVLLIYRWYRTIGIMARIIRGKDVEVGLKYLSVKNNSATCCSGRSVVDKCLSAVMWLHDKCYYLRYTVFKMFYWVTAVLQLVVVGSLILMLYILADQVLTVDFIHDLGTFNLMTTGIAAQRAVRNQVLSTTALSYNNYTISTIEQASSDFAATKNQESWEWNLGELERVDEFNNYFCSAWAAYQSTVRNVASDGDIQCATSTAEHLAAHLFDGDVSSSFTPFPDYEDGNDTTDGPVVVEVELPVIEFTESQSSFWEISQLNIHWNFIRTDDEHSLSDSEHHIAFTIETKLEAAQKWVDQTSGHQHGHFVFDGAPYSKLNDIQSINMYLNETRYLRLTFSNASQWGDSFEIAEINIFGAAPRDKIICDRVRFHFWSFDASKVEMEECPSITPVFGNMYIGFVRKWVNAQLLESHKPFILAVRNIALSPFFILLGGILCLIVVYLLGFMMESMLIRFDLFRENLYAKIPLITTKWDEYDPERHYVTSPSDSEQESESDVLSGGARPMSPRGLKKRRRHLASHFSPIKRRSEDEIELTVLSPRGPQFVQMDDASEGVPKSTKKTTGKIKSRLTSPLTRGRDHGVDRRRMLSPDRSFGARALAQMMFQQKLNKSARIESDDVDVEDEDGNGNHNMSVGCKQQ